MRNHRNLVLCTVAAALLTIMGGCTGADPRLSNQGGGSILSAGSKLVAGNIGDMNPDEWQIVGDNVATLATQFQNELGDVQIPILSDEQAAAIVTFLDQNNLQTLQQLIDAIDSGTLDDAEVPPELLELI